MQKPRPSAPKTAPVTRTAGRPVVKTTLSAPFDAGYRCRSRPGNDANVCSRGEFDCCETDADCPRHTFCVIVSDGTEHLGAAGAASARSVGYCEVGDGTFETLTAGSSASSTTGSGGTRSSSDSGSETASDDKGVGGCNIAFEVSGGLRMLRRRG